MQLNEFKKLVRAGENSRVEFKSRDFHNDSLAKEIVALSNMKGGKIYIGVRDNGELEDIEQKIEERIVNICRNNILPSIIPDIETLLIEDKRILCIHIDKGRHKPYKVKKSDKFYIRAGSVSIEPSNEELVRLFQDGEHLHFEVSSVFPYHRKQFDILRFRDYVETYRGIECDEADLDQLLYNLHCIDEENRVSVVGALFFTRTPSRFLPQSGIECNSFAGPDTGSEITDYQAEDCGIVQCIEYAIGFVKRHSRVQLAFDSETGHRTEFPNYDTGIVRELIVNAFMHRDWSIFGQRIRLNLFADRLEVFSPGSLPNTLNLTRALSGISYYRNPIISQMLKDYRIADRVGRGLQKVVNYYQERALRPPVFDVDHASFRVTLWEAGAEQD